jgi:outer membrane protein assembly factor BamD
MGNPVNDDAQYFLGIKYYKREQYLLAAYELSKLIRDIPSSEFVQDAQFMLADAYYQQSPNFQLEQSYTKKAVDEFQAFIEFFPIHPKVPEAEKKIQELNHKFAEKEFHSAEIYEKMEYYNAAIKYYTQVYETYHDTEYAPLALYKKIMLLVEKDRVDESLRSIADYLEKYPKNDKVDELKNIKTELLAEFNG